jgi:hypothetical protein
VGANARAGYPGELMSAASTDQLAWEARAGRLAAAAAALSAILFVAGSVYFGSTVRERPRGIDGRLVLIDREPAAFVVSGVLLALGFLLLGVVVGYLLRATRHRRPELPRATLPLLVFGALVAAGVAVARQVEFLSVASDFLASTPRTADRARDLLRESPVLQVIDVLGLAANFALGLAIGLIAVNAIRAGTLSQFMGILGIVIGALVALPLLGGVVFLLLFFWLFALAALFLDRWPGGRGPAWSSGAAEPWPTVSQRNAALKRRREELDRDSDSDEAEATGEADIPGESGGAGPAEKDEAGPASAADGGSAGNGAAAVQRRSKRKRGRRS